MRANLLPILGAAALLALMLLPGREHLLSAYLVGWIPWAGLTIGLLGLTLVQNAVRGAWGLPLVRIFEAGGGTLTLISVFVAALPIVLGAKYVFPWAMGGPDASTWYLNVPFFWIRMAVYLLVWGAVARGCRRASLRGSNASAFASASLVALFITGTLASYDWLMSLEKEWTSSIFGFLFLITSALGAMGFALAFVFTQSERRPYKGLIGPGLTRDWGNLLLTILLLWAYFTYSQYIVVWSGDIKREALYFVRRSGGGWDILSVALVALGFFGPLLALTASRTKHSISLLGTLGGWMTVVFVLDMYWMAAPEFAGQAPLWAEAVVFVAVGAIWFGAFSRTLAAAPRLPEHDPRVGRAIDRQTAEA